MEPWMVPMLRLQRRLERTTCSFSERELLESTKSERSSTREREAMLEEDYRESLTPSSQDSSEILRLFTQSLTVWPMVEIITLPASIFTDTSTLKLLLTQPTETTKSGQLWPLKVLPNLESSLPTEPSLNIAARSGTFNQCQSHILPQTQIRELEVSPTLQNSSEQKCDLNRNLTIKFNF